MISDNNSSDYSNSTKLVLPESLRSPKPLTKDIFDKLDYDDIAAITYCGYGAMGEEGVVWIIDRQLHRYGITIDRLHWADFNEKIKLFHGAVDYGNGQLGAPRIWASANSNNYEMRPFFKIKDVPEWYGIWMGGGGNYMYVRKEYVEGMKEYMHKKGADRMINHPGHLYSNRWEMLCYSVSHYDK